MSSRDPASNQLQQHKQQQQNHQPTLTTSNGAPVDSLTASLTIGTNQNNTNNGGHIALQDFTLIDHLSKFDRERIPERVVHAKGGGAGGYFEVTNAAFIKTICKAKMFEADGKRTPVFVRFSTVGGESGSADTARDPRGFAVKFYTEEGNWDLVGNNTPIFFLRDPILFPSFIHTQKRNPQTHLNDADMFWDFISLRPETIHQVSFLFSDRGIPDGFRHMNGYGSHTFKNVNASQQAVYVKYHLKTDQGIANLSTQRAAALASSDANYAIGDLYNAIAKEDYPSWTMYVQVMTYEQAAKASFHPFDVTKVWPHAEFPLEEVGRLILNRNPENYFAEVEQAAFAPAHMIPGIEPSPDKMLQGRLFSYPDTHRHRLGVNYQSIPVNCPFRVKGLSTSSTYQRDGAMTVSSNGGGAPNYFPNSFHGPQPDSAAAWHVDSVAAKPNDTGDICRTDTGHEDNFSQCATFFNRVLDEGGRERLTSNIAGHLCGAQEAIRHRVVEKLLNKVDRRHGQMVEEKMRQLLMQEAAGDVNGRKEQKKVAPLSPPRVVPSIKSKL